MNPEEDVDFEDLVGEELDFYGVDGNCFRLDDTTYEVIEEEDDSHIVVSEECLTGMPIARVVVECNDTIYTLVDLHDGHHWLRLGMDYSNAWFPLFVFDYTPKGPRD